MSVPRVSDTCLRYVAALYDPKNTFEEPWVPRDAQLSCKRKLFARGSFATGTTGYGGIVVSPCLANDVAFVTMSTATTVATSSTLVSAWTNTSTAPRLNGQFASAAFGSTAGLVKGRVVGLAVYVRYAGTELNFGGSLVYAEHPEHDSIVAYSYDSILGLDGVHREDIPRGWAHVCWLPTESDSFEDFEFGVAYSTATNRHFGFFVNSAGATQPFDYEVYEWVEFVGEPARGATISFNDPIGFDAVTGAIEEFGQLDSVEGLKGLITAIESQLMNQSLPSANHPSGNWVGLLSFLPALKELAMPALKAAGTSILSSLTSGTAERLERNGVQVPASVARTQPPPKKKTAPPAPKPPAPKVEVKVEKGKKKKKKRNKTKSA